MRPFFSYYGSKWVGARHYGPPRRDLVIEPFAGSACYATRYAPAQCLLYDLNADVVAAWDWLIRCSEADVRRLPDAFHSSEDWLALPDGPRQVVDWNINYAQGRVSKKLANWYLRLINEGTRTGPLFDKTRNRNNPVRFWGPQVKSLIIGQQPFIAKWAVEHCSYADIPNQDAHWHIDPPYQGKPGRAYQHNAIDFAHLAEWCRERLGAVDVCENEGADWLDFQPLYSLKSQNAKRPSKEVVWRKDFLSLPLGQGG